MQNKDDDFWIWLIIFCCLLLICSSCNDNTKVVTKEVRVMTKESDFTHAVIDADKLTNNPELGNGHIGMEHLEVDNTSSLYFATYKICGMKYQIIQHYNTDMVVLNLTKDSLEVELAKQKLNLYHQNKDTL